MTQKDNKSKEKKVTINETESQNEILNDQENTSKKNNDFEPPHDKIEDDIKEDKLKKRQARKHQEK